MRALPLLVISSCLALSSNTRILSQVLPGFGRSVALHYDASTESPAGAGT